MKAVGLGACVYDTLIALQEYPREDTKQKAENVFVSGGGPVGNALAVLAKLGVQAEYIGAFADDAAGKFLKEDFARCGVRCDRAAALEGARSFCSYILLGAAGNSRTCVFERGTVPDDPKNVNTQAINGADVLHLDGNYLHSALFAAKYAKSRGITVSLDAGGRYEGIEALLPLCDVLIPSAEFALGLTGEKNVQDACHALYERYTPRVLAVTDGSRGGVYRAEDGSMQTYAARNIQAIDTNGAGDTFHAAFLAAYLRGKSVQACCDYASAVAAYKCEHSGLRNLSFDTFAL